MFATRRSTSPAGRGSRSPDRATATSRRLAAPDRRRWPRSAHRTRIRQVPAAGTSSRSPPAPAHPFPAPSGVSARDAGAVVGTRGISGQLLRVRLRESLSSALPLFRRLSQEQDRLRRRSGVLEDRPRVVLKQPNRKLSPAEIDELVAAYEAGTPIAHLSARFGMHRQTVRFHLKRRGVPLRSDTPALTTAQIDEATKLYATGLSTSKIGGQFGISASTVQKALRARGVRLRPPADRGRG